MIPWPKLTTEEWRKRLGLPEPKKSVRLDAHTLRAAQRVGIVTIEKFDPNEPRDDHGRWTDGGGAGGDSGGGDSGVLGLAQIPAGETVADSDAASGKFGSGTLVNKLLAKTGIAPDEKIEERAQLQQIAGAIGVEDVKIVNLERTANEHYFGIYDPMTGDITLNEKKLGLITASAWAHTVMHENTHRLFDLADRKVNDELRNFMVKNFAKLRSEDGTTPYTRGFWDEVGAKEGSQIARLDRSWPMRAINESLADQSALGKFTPTYAKLRDKVNKLANS